MEVLKNHVKGVGGPAEDPINYLGFEELADIGGDNIFNYGVPHPKIFQPSDKPKYFFSTEEQSWDIDTTDIVLEYVDKILTICPPSITNRKKREYVFFPFNEKYIPITTNKTFDVIYCGSATGAHVTEILQTISKFDYRFVSFGNQQYVTNVSLSYLDKLKMISESRITMVHSLTGIGTPQIKTRPFEAAFSKSLILCKKDKWNIIEEWFQPEKEFIYYNDGIDLENIIKEVLKNYDSYLSMINAAYEKALDNYTTRHFVEKYLK